MGREEDQLKTDAGIPFPKEKAVDEKADDGQMSAVGSDYVYEKSVQGRGEGCLRLTLEATLKTPAPADGREVEVPEYEMKIQLVRLRNVRIPVNGAKGDSLQWRSKLHIDVFPDKFLLNNSPSRSLRL